MKYTCFLHIAPSIALAVEMALHIRVDLGLGLPFVAGTARSIWEKTEKGYFT